MSRQWCCWGLPPLLPGFPHADRRPPTHQPCCGRTDAVSVSRLHPPFQKNHLARHERVFRSNGDETVIGNEIFQDRRAVPEMTNRKSDIGAHGGGDHVVVVRHYPIDDQ